MEKPTTDNVNTDSAKASQENKDEDVFTIEVLTALALNKMEMV